MTLTEKDLRSWLRGLPVFPDAVSPFDTENLPQNPSALFLDWLEHAASAGQLAPHAACLSVDQ